MLEVSNGSGNVGRFDSVLLPILFPSIIVLLLLHRVPRELYGGVSGRKVSQRGKLRLYKICTMTARL